MANYEYITSTGVIVPDTSTTLEHVQTEFKTAFGTDLDVSPETPQGVLIVAETEARDAVARNNADLANQINPSLAGGVFLDALWALMGGQRFVASPSLVRGVVMSGVPGTPIPAGAQALAGQNLFQLTGAVILNSSGTATGDFQSVLLGPITAPAGALNVIASSVLGWETVTNPTAAELGQAQETDTAARIRRRNTLALQSVTMPEAATSGLADVPGVKSSVFRENTTNATITIEGQSLVPHSVFACVDGGTDLDVATVLLRKKSGGAGWNGTTTVNVVEPFSRQTYAVKFSRPAVVQIYVRVTVAGGSSYPNAPEVVRAAMLAYAQGEQDQEPGFVVGGDVSPFELGAAVNAAAPPLYVKDCQLSTDGTTFSPSEVVININQKAGLIAGNIAVTVLP